MTKRAQIVDFYTASFKVTLWQSLMLRVQGCDELRYNGYQKIDVVCRFIILITREVVRFSC